MLEAIIKFKKKKLFLLLILAVLTCFSFKTFGSYILNLIVIVETIKLGVQLP